MYVHGKTVVVYLPSGEGRELAAVNKKLVWFIVFHIVGAFWFEFEAYIDCTIFDWGSLGPHQVFEFDNR